MPFGKRLVAAAVILIAAMIAPETRSQDVANGSATATVLTILSASSTQDLNFGNIFQGVAKTMGNDDDDSSAVFTITGQARAGILVQLTLPGYLSLADGSDRMDIVFANNVCSVDTLGTADPSTVVGDYVDVDPRNIPSGVIVGGAGTTNIFLGGRVTPSAAQKAGAYSGDMVMSVSYNGT